MKRQLFLSLSLVIFFASCVKEPKDYPPEPQIYYQSMTPRLLDLNDTAARLNVEFKFNDGDGDIGTDASQTKMNIFLKDSRDTTSAPYTLRFPFPYIADYMRPKKGGIEGFITIHLGKQFFSIVDSLHIALRKDTIQYSIYVEDDAGHKSNVTLTDTLFIQF